MGNKSNSEVFRPLRGGDGEECVQDLHNQQRKGKIGKD